MLLTAATKVADIAKVAHAAAERTTKNCQQTVTPTATMTVNDLMWIVGAFVLVILFLTIGFFLSKKTEGSESHTLNGSDFLKCFIVIGCSVIFCYLVFMVYQVCYR